MAKSQSDTYPALTEKSRGLTLYRYNIREVQVTDSMTGIPRTAYEYDECEVKGPVTRAKVLEAMRLAEIEDNADDVSSDTATQYLESKSALVLSELSNLTYEQLDTYIEKNVTTLATSKVFLKKLAIVVLALVKQRS